MIESVRELRELSLSQKLKRGLGCLAVASGIGLIVEGFVGGNSTRLVEGIAGTISGFALATDFHDRDASLETK